MIKINLLPEELKKRESRFKKFDLSNIDLHSAMFLHVGLSVLVVIIILHAVLFVVESYSKSQFKKLSKRYDQILPQKKEADSLRLQNDTINNKVSAINELMVKRFSWTKCLDALSDSMTNGIWLNDLTYGEKSEERPVEAKPSGAAKKDPQAAKIVTEKIVTRSLVIMGYAASRGEEGAAVVGRFIKSLKDNVKFYSNFSSIELVSIKSDKQNDQEVMSFKISCLFK